MGSSVITANKFKRVSGGNRTLIDGHTLNYRKGNDWYVDASRSGTGSGKSFDDAFLTMAEAFAKIGSGDSIYFTGKIVEQLVTPVQVFDVRVVGMGNRPRHADSTPAGGNTHASQWAPPASGGVAAQATVRVLQQGWTFENILFTAVDADAGMIELVRNADSGNSERDASHASIIGCRFAGAGIGIKVGASGFTELVFNVLVDDNKFNSCTFGIGGDGQLNQPIIRNNHFTMNTNSIDVAVEGGAIYDNIMGKFTTASIKLSGGVGTDPNVVTKNYLFGTYSIAGGYTVHHADDEWAGNFNTLAGGITVSDPA
jgi:hypothetical protein